MRRRQLQLTGLWPPRCGELCVCISKIRRLLRLSKAYVHGKTPAAPARAGADERPSALKAAQQRDESEYRSHLENTAANDPDPRRRIGAGVVLEKLAADDAAQAAQALKAAKPRADDGYAGYLGRVASIHPDPARRLRAQAQLDKLAATTA